MLFGSKKGVLIMLAAVLVLGACGSPGAPENLESNGEDTVEQGEVVAVVNGENIYEAPYFRLMDRMKINYQEQGIDFESDEGQVMLQQLEEQAIQFMIQQEVLVQEAKNRGVTVEEEAVEAEAQAIRDQFDTDEEFQAVLEQNHFTEKELMDTLAAEMTVDALLNQEVGEVTVSEEELEEMYQFYEMQQEEQLEAMKESGEEISEEDLAMMELPPYEEIKESLRMQLMQEKEQEAEMAVIEQLMEASEIEILI